LLPQGHARTWNKSMSVAFADNEEKAKAVAQHRAQ
jgi:hypothetical protein